MPLTGNEIEVANGFPVELPLAKLTPEAAVNFSYDLHCVQDPFTGPEATELSKRALKELYALGAPEGSREAWYLSNVYTTVVSHGKGLSTLKDQHVAELKAAELFLETRQNQLSRSQTLSAFFRGGWKVAGTFAMGVFGFATTKVLSLLGYVPTVLLNDKGHTETTVSLMIAVVFFTGYGMLVTWYNNLVEARIHKEYANLEQGARIRYARSKQVELDATWEKLCKFWQWYTGQEWGAMPAYMRVMKSDVEMTLRRTELLEESARSTIGSLGVQLMAWVRQIRKRIRREEGQMPSGSPL